jgi:cytosine/adenosine deaminase-related metal-dependent hydrolase
MIIAYEGALLATSHGAQWETLVIQTKTGIILPASEAKYADQKVNAEGLALYPGLINAHDHLDKNHYPRTRWRDRYDNASQWATDTSRRLDDEPYHHLRSYHTWERYWVGGIKNLICGVSTVIHHDYPHSPIKFWRKANFPVRPESTPWAHSVYLTDPETIQRYYHKAGSRPFVIHLAEGTDEDAARELDQLDQLGCLGPNTKLVHGVGIRDTERAIARSGGLIWCPSSNLYLLGQTAEVKEWYREGKLALGSDSRLTAEGDLLDELRAAYQTGQLDAESLFHLVTDYPARLLQLNNSRQIPLGDLLPGYSGAFFALPLPSDGDVYSRLVNARRTDIQWVVRGGRVLWARDDDNPNCLLDGVPYHLIDSLYHQVKHSRLSQTLDGGLLRLDNYPDMVNGEIENAL